MAFAKKTWKDRIAEFPTRRRLTKEDNTSELVTVAREEGTLSQEGDAFSAENMNDLESRIDAEFTEVNGKLIKYKDFNFTNLSNTKSDIYYLTLSDNISSDIDDGSIVVLSAQILFWTSIGGEILNVSYDDFAKTLKLLFPRGSIFQKGQVQVRCTYIKNLD